MGDGQRFRATLSVSRCALGLTGEIPLPMELLVPLGPPAGQWHVHT